MLALAILFHMLARHQVALGERLMDISCGRFIGLRCWCGFNVGDQVWQIVSAPVRGAQLAQIFPVLDEATHALLVGDFNFCASWPEENARLLASYTDLWPALHPHDPGYTEDTAINRMRLARTGKAKQVASIAYCCAPN